MIYGSRSVTLREMIRVGLLVDLLGIAVIWMAAVWWVPGALRVMGLR